jgi:hypothetical protein
VGGKLVGWTLMRPEQVAESPAFKTMPEAI